MKNKNDNIICLSKNGSYINVIKKSFLVFWGIDKDDGGIKTTKNVAKTASKGIAYYLSDYALTALSPITVGLFKWIGWTDFEITFVIWLEDALIAYGLVLFSQKIIKDFTLTEALRNSINLIWGKNKIIAAVLSGIILIRFSLWDGPERVAIFFHKELKKRYQEILIIILFSLFQAIFWTKLYSLGINGLVGIWKVIF
jgi:hypothetical protein